MIKKVEMSKSSFGKVKKILANMEIDFRIRSIETAEVFCMVSFMI